jgi:hypothetical protein
MTRTLVVSLTLAALLALAAAAPAGAADTLNLTSASPANGARRPLTPTGGIQWNIAAAGVPADAAVQVTISSSPNLAADGTLDTANRLDFFFLQQNGLPGGWSGRSDPGPNAWSADAGTYYWQAVATFTDSGGTFHTAATGVARLILGTAPAGGGPTGGGGGGQTPSRRTSLRMLVADAPYYVRTLIRRQTKRTPAGLRYACARRTTASFRCRPTWRDSRNLYRTTATFTHVRVGGRVVARGTITGRRASRQCVRRRSFARCDVAVRWRATIAARPFGRR